MRNAAIFVSLAFAAVIVFVAACGGSAEQTEPTTPDPAEAEPEGAEPVAEPTEAAAGEDGPSWADMDHDARMALMRERVMPEIGGMFREFDDEEFATVTCMTCHGENPPAVNFAMPNGVHPLVPAEIPTMAQSDDEETARFAQFMFEQVTPGMVQILNVPPYNPETHEGFGCLSCHETAE